MTISIDRTSTGCAYGIRFNDITVPGIVASQHLTLYVGVRGIATYLGAETSGTHLSPVMLGIGTLVLWGNRVQLDIVK